MEAFCYSVSHDLRAPLRSIEGFSKALVDDYTEKFDAQGKVKAIIEEKKLEDINEIFDDMLKGEINGRIVVTI